MNYKIGFYILLAALVIWGIWDLFKTSKLPKIVITSTSKTGTEDCIIKYKVGNSTDEFTLDTSRPLATQGVSIAEGRVYPHYFEKYVAFTIIDPTNKTSNVIFVDINKCAGLADSAVRAAE